MNYGLLAIGILGFCVGTLIIGLLMCIKNILEHIAISLQELFINQERNKEKTKREERDML
jgi:hypothetical protein